MGRLDVHIRHGGDNGSGEVAAVAVLLIIVAVGARAAWPHIVHVIEDIFWATVWAVAGTAGAVIAFKTGRVAYRARARRAAQQATYRATVIPAERLPEPPAITKPTEPPALGQAPRHKAGDWPLPGWWQEIRPRIGGDDDDTRRQ